MTKEQQIFQNMKRRGRIYKAHGKWCISYAKLVNAIIEAGYDRDTADRIIENMLAKNYIRQCKNVNGRTATDQGMSHRLGNYVILKWVN